MTQSMDEQIRGHYPTIHMTIVSIVVALVFENLFAFMLSQDDLWSLSKALLWVQAAIVVINGVLFWYHSSLVASSLRQIFRLQDAANPFLVLFVLNILVATMGKPDFSAFFFVLGAQVFTGVQVFGLWEHRYEVQRAEASVRGSFKAARRLGALIGLSMILIGVGGWSGVLPPIGATLGGLAFLAAAVGLQSAWQRGWEMASGVTP